MPVAHIGLTVSHLPTSTSFFLSALQPLGYRYIGESGHQIGLGIHNADFFLCQETPGVKAGAAHIAFTAPSTTAVRNFYTAALIAGGRPNGSPATRCAETGHFNAAVLDFDGNSIEAVYRNGPDVGEDGTVYEHSRIITWHRTVTTTTTTTTTSSSSYRASSTLNTYTSTSASRASPAAASPAESAVPKPPSVVRSFSADDVMPAPKVTKSESNEGAGKQLFGALLGAAAGAAVAYAFARSERDSAKKEAEFNAFLDAKSAVKSAASLSTQTPAQPEPPQQTPQPEPPAQPAQPAQPTPETTAPPKSPKSVHRNSDDDDARSVYSRASQIPKSSVPRQIEAAPADYYAPSQFGGSSALAQARAIEYAKPRAIEYAEPQAIEYAPAYSRAPSAAPSRLTSANRASTSPDLLMLEQARSTVSAARPDGMASSLKPPRPHKSHSVVSKAHSAAPSAAPSSFISSFVADNEDTKSIRSHRSSRSKAKSSHSRHGSRKERDSSPSPPPSESKATKVPPKVPFKAASIVSNLFKRDKAKNEQDDDDDFIDDLDVDEQTEDDLDTVVPDDSISQIGDGPRRRHRSHRHKSKKNDDAETSVSHRSKKHTEDAESSAHHRSKKHVEDDESSVSKSTRRSHRSRSHKTSDSADDEDSGRAHRSSRSSKHKPSITSEPSEVSTVRPVKTSSSSSKSSRKDSLTQGQYDQLFDEVQYGTGSVRASRYPPTPSMVSAARKNPMRTMINFNHAQKMRNFEGSQAGMARHDDD
ncbi:hypothetical protein yc1106_00444 [Curvularia clavata]|uniref:VOC domain-containing protein n=1 Tax=Curvularia clavata TaxID=95742 RepID=A0A9Q8Z0B7_CURCL|nr:hypothetical protein yc1106_00444 [Curvularia clavata]